MDNYVVLYKKQKTLYRHPKKLIHIEKIRKRIDQDVVNSKKHSNICYLYFI